MGRISIAVSLALAFGVASQAHAGAGCKVMKVAELPVTMVGLVPTTSVKINGKEARLIVDSGAFFSMITPPNAEHYGLKIGPAPYGVTIQGIGGQQELSVGTAVDFEIDKIPVKNVQFIVSEGRFAGVAGLLGQNILGALDTEYDLANGVVRLFKSEGCNKAMLAYWAQKGPYSVVDIRPTTPAAPHLVGTIKINGQPVRATFDTGAPVSYLSLSAARRVGFDPAAAGVEKEAATGGIGRNVRATWIGRFNTFDTDGETVQNVRLRVFDTKIGESEMLVGADFFLSHRIYVSKAQHRLFMTYNGGPVFRLDGPGATLQASSAPSPSEGAEGPTTADAFTRRAAASTARHDFAHAIADYSQAIKLEPKEPAHYRDRAMAHVGAGEPKRAMDDLDAAVKLAPEDPKLRLARGALALTLKEDARAEGDFAAALKAAPDEAMVVMAIGQLYSEQAQYERAIAAYDRWIGAHPQAKDLKRLLNSRCWARAIAGQDLQKALADCDAALALDARYAAALDSRGLVNLRLGRLDQAIADYNAALRVSPNNSWSYYGRGLAKRAKGLSSQANSDIAKAITLDPTTPTTAAKYGVRGDAMAAN